MNRAERVRVLADAAWCPRCGAASAIINKGRVWCDPAKGGCGWSGRQAVSEP